MAVKITLPVDGAILSNRDGHLTEAGLEIEVEGVFQNEVSGHLQINGRSAERSGDHFKAKILLKERETEITASISGQISKGSRTRVIWRGDFPPVFRLAVDDNIFFLRDLARSRPKGIFENFYLQGLRKIHQRTGLKVVLNLFFSTIEGDFNLSEFPSDYLSQFDDNADWLKMAFHAYKETPDRPYQCAEGAANLGRDYDMVASEIIRFAGERVYSPTTVTHWAMIHQSAWGILHSRGSRLLSGYFVPYSGSNYQGGDEEVSADLPGNEFDINYCMDAERSSWLSHHELLKDFNSGMFFSKVDICCNLTPVSKVVPILSKLRANPATADVMDLITHEQYFWPSYVHYLPDHFERCMAAAEFCSQNGYRPIFFHEDLVAALD